MPRPITLLGYLLSTLLISPLVLADKPCPPVGFGLADEGVIAPDSNCGTGNSYTPSPPTPALSPQLAEFAATVDALITPEWVGNAGTDVVEGYNRFPLVDGLVDMYLATGDSRYAQLSVDISLAYLRGGRDMDGDQYLDWHSPYSPQWGNINHWHYEWRAGAAIGRTLGLISSSAELRDRFASEHAEMVAFLEFHLWEKWTYPFQSNNLAGQDNLTFTHSTYFIGRLGMSAIGLHQATGKQKYLDWLNKRGAELVNSLLYIPGKDAYNMTAITDGTDGGGRTNIGTIDVGHSSDAVSFLTHAYFEAYDLGNTLTPTVMQRLTNSVTNVMWAGTSWTMNVNGSGGSCNCGQANGNGGWARLAAFEPSLLQKYTNWILQPSYPFEVGLNSYVAVRTYGAIARATAYDERNIDVTAMTDR